MKKYKVHISAPFPLIKEFVIQEGISEKFAERIEISDFDNQFGTIVLSVNTENPDEDELTELILLADETEFGIHFGYPSDDNCINCNDCWHLLDSCEVTE